MTFEKLIFYILAVLLILSATMVITRRNPVHAALSLILAFAASTAGVEAGRALPGEAGVT